ncbi:MAG: Uma2 family endonuclease [Isosphaeraceae bacterium]
MSTISRSRAPTPPAPEPDPFRYGWRYIKETQPDGAVEFKQVPLTLEDVLFPEVGDFIVHTVGHASDLIYLANVCRARLADNPEAVVLHDCRTDWNLSGVRPLGPDISVFLGLSRYTDWKTFDVALEHAKPAMVVEVTSPDTRGNDLGPKREFYHRAGVPLYVIADVDENEQERHIKIIVLRHTPGGYERIAPDARGWIWLEPVRVWLGVTQDPRGGFDRLACFDPETGEEIGDYAALAQQLVDWKARTEQAEDARAQAEEARKQAEEARAQAEQAHAQAEQARAQAEARALAEAEARSDSERRLRELESELERLRRGE